LMRCCWPAYQSVLVRDVQRSLFRDMRRSITHLAQQHTAIILILIAFLGLGVTYSIVNPLFESPDEVWHYQYVKYLADGHGLPVSDLVSEMPWHQEGSQPPLYYLLGAGLTLWIDTGDADAVIRYNPHAAVGQADAADNKNMMVHTSLEAFPYRGTVLAVHLMRLLSVLMGAATVLCTYLTALTIFPGQQALATVAAVVNGFNPQFIFISASVNNDNLVVLLSSIAVLLLMRIWQGRIRPGHLALLGLIAGLTAMSKLNGLILLPFIAVLLMVTAWRRRSLCDLLRWGLMVSVPTLAVAGWWYYRNWLLYGDPFGLAAMFTVLPAQAEGPALAELLARAEGVYRSAWGVFGWFNVVAEPWLYAVYTGLTVAGVAGLGLLVIRRLRRDDRTGLSALAWSALWSLVVLAALIGWSQKRYPQGRLLFPAISAFSVLLAAGLTQGIARLSDRWRQVGAGVLAAGLFALAVWVPLHYIAPAYAPRPLLADLPSDALPLRVDFGGQAQLLGYELPEDSVRLGETLPLTLYWQALSLMEEDYTVFTHLLLPPDQVWAQEDDQLQDGQSPTSTWQPGQIIQDHYELALLAEAPPGVYEIEIGLYLPATGDRLKVGLSDAGIVLGKVKVQK